MGNLNAEDSPSLELSASAVRQRAEALLTAGAAAAALPQSPEAVADLLHELQVHQLELELQNEELRRAQIELELARARYFDLYDMAPVGYVTLSAQWEIKEANLTAATMLELPRSALIGRPLARLVAPEDQEIYYHYRRTLAQMGGQHRCHLRVIRPGHAPLWAQLEAALEPAAPGEAATYRLVMSDITALVEAEAAVRELNATLERRVAEQTEVLRLSEANLRRTNIDLERALRLKDEFLSTMSHELRTPLSILLSITESLSEEIYGTVSAAQIKALATITQSGHHLLDLLSDILDMSRLSAGIERLELRLVDSAMICQLAMQIITPLAQERQIQLTSCLGSAGFQIWADERRLLQVLLNLLNNAVKFTPEGGAVGLEAGPDAALENFLFCVWDSGIGIAPEDQERIFAPFTQVEGHLARTYGGTGLGLAIVRRLIALHGGRVSLVSQVGQGSRFTISLPIAGAPPAEQAG